MKKKYKKGDILFYRYWQRGGKRKLGNIEIQKVGRKYLYIGSIHYYEHKIEIETMFDGSPCDRSVMLFDNEDAYYYRKEYKGMRRSLSKVDWKRIEDEDIEYVYDKVFN